MTTRDTIKKCMSEHTANGGLICAQSLLGAGGVANTVSLDNKQGLEDLPISDSSNPGIIVGMALAGRRPVYIIRYQGFLVYNMASIIMYAAKSKEIWNQPCPLFVRAIGMNGSIGPVASNTYASWICHIPNIKVVSPITPIEYNNIWQDFLSKDDPVFCSETRHSFDIDYEINDVFNYKKPDITIISFGETRITLNKSNLYNKYKINSGNIVYLKPLHINDSIIQSCQNSKYVLILDNGHENCGISQYIAFHLMNKFNIKSSILGLEDRSAGFSSTTDNLPPSSSKIELKIKQLLNESY